MVLAFEGAPMVNYVEGMNKKYVWYDENKKVRVKKLVRGQYNISRNSTNKY
nr:hypothetical protein [Candidatus Nanopusillus massiliensis]